MSTKEEMYELVNKYEETMENATDLRKQIFENIANEKYNQIFDDKYKQEITNRLFKTTQQFKNHLENTYYMEYTVT